MKRTVEQEVEEQNNTRRGDKVCKERQELTQTAIRKQMQRIRNRRRDTTQENAT